MYIACIPHGSNPATLRQALAAVPSLDMLVLPAGDSSDGGTWLADTFRELRCELFLHPELQVLASGDLLSLSIVVSQLGNLLVESHSDNTTIARVHADDRACSLEYWNSAGEDLLHAQSKAALPSKATIQSANVYFGARPYVEAIDSEAKIILSGPAAPGSLALAASYNALQLQTQDWNRLATAATIARLVEQPQGAEPLWIEVDEMGAPLLMAPPALDISALQNQIEPIQPPAQLQLPDVSITSVPELSATASGQYQLDGQTGSPPNGQYLVDFQYQLADDPTIQRWPTYVRKSSIDWNITVQSAKDWTR